MKTLFWGWLALPLLIVHFAFAESSPHIGEFPKLIVTTLNNESFDLKQKQGKWVLIHFFATWCPGCKTELPELTALYQKYHPSQLEILVLSPEASRKKSDVKDFIKAYPFPAALLADAKVNDFGRVGTLPTSYLVDPNGKIKLMFVPKDHELDPKEIETALNQKSPTQKTAN